MVREYKLRDATMQELLIKNSLAITPMFGDTSNCLKLEKTLTQIHTLRVLFSDAMPTVRTILIGTLNSLICPNSSFEIVSYSVALTKNDFKNNLDCMVLELKDSYSRGS